MSLKGGLRPAVPADAEILTRIAFAAKGHWGYPESYMERWIDELTITKEYIGENRVFCWEDEDQVYGFYSLVKVLEDQRYELLIVEKGLWLDHMFILPDHHGKGIGRNLFQDLVNRMIEEDAGTLRIFCDPNACGFYEKMGARLIRQSPSTIPGRTIPVYLYQISS